ncbi:uncharacterized protein LOC106085850 [Stomoxys calcitrans]|uniref:uncharacterized protein LOC106085850 n=1 Tax=Stomoxys calcitrans TaxID=35570 RepID=UPI0027E2FCED|nr:uncharacterized protein LOC106085850 [Stomoxys calcitrans]
MIHKPPIIKIRNLKELQCSQKAKAELEDPNATPIKAKKPRRKAATTGTKAKKVTLPNEEIEQERHTPKVENPDVAPPPAASTVKRLSKSARKEPPPSQLRINIFFKPCEKTYKIEPLKEQPTPLRKAATEIKKQVSKTTTTKKNGKVIKNRRSKMGRKRLFTDNDTSSTMNSDSDTSNQKRAMSAKEKGSSNITEVCINLISDSDDDDAFEKKTIKIEKKENSVDAKTSGNNSRVSRSSSVTYNGVSKTHTVTTTAPMACDSGTSKAHISPNTATSTSSPTATIAAVKTPATTRRKPKPCPPYKIIEGSTFAVDAFQYGYIEGVTHYFLTHFHADHYIGLTRKFAMPLFMSTITARFVRAFIPIDEKYIHELELNTPIDVNGIEVTALDANHCPGAIMLLFKIKSSSQCILHTGDFRAWHGMEEEPVFWNNHINTIYLDTTYLSQKYAFCTQYESIDRAKHLVQEFQAKHAGKSILYICGSYVIGKERFWSSLAEEFALKVWTEDNRSKALKAMNDKHLNQLLIENPLEADMHVIAMGKLSYMSLVDYFALYQQRYDICLALRPSGWEKDTRPQYRGTINIIGVEYSEHSSYEEMKRFVKFLKPDNVISTVPTGRDLMKTSKVPESWYKYEKLQQSSNYQPRIEQYLRKSTPMRKAIIRGPNPNKGGIESAVSPLSMKNVRNKREKDKNNNCEDSNSVIMTNSPAKSTSANEFENPMVWLPQSQKNKENSQKKIKQEKPEKNLHLRTSKARNEVPLLVPDKKKTDENSGKQLKEGDNCSIYISNDSSELFEKPMPKVACRRRIISCSSDEEFVAKPNKTKLREKRNAFKPSMPSTVEENEADFVENSVRSTKKKKADYDNYLDEQPCTSKEALRRLAISNPLLKSTTTSCASTTTSANEEVQDSQASDDFELMARPIRNKNLRKDVIPSSQTTFELKNTPRPLRNKYKTTRHEAKQQHDSQNDFIPASQTTADLANTPRPLRNKRTNTTPLTSLVTSPVKKVTSPKNNAPLSPISDEDGSQPELVTQIVKNTKHLDFYNSSQMNVMVQNLLSSQKLDTSKDHIPPELLSDNDALEGLDAQDDWLD